MIWYATRLAVMVLLIGSVRSAVSQSTAEEYRGWDAGFARLGVTGTSIPETIDVGGRHSHLSPIRTPHVSA